MQHHKYGSVSESKLLTCHEDVQLIAREGLERSPYDITIVHGFRDNHLQNKLFREGASKTPWPKSKHNRMLENTDGFLQPHSWAFDFGPWIDGAVPWEDTHIFAFIAGIFIAVALDHDIAAVWGGDFDGDGSTKDQTLLDYGHIHIIPK